MRCKRISALILMMILLLGLSGCAGKTATTPNIQEGTLDISGNFDLLEQKPLLLDGNWAFYWKQFLIGDSLENTKPDLYGVVPKAWNHYTINGKSLPAAGYGTYRLHIVSDLPEGTVLGLQVPYFASAYRLYVNDKEIAKNGIAATDADQEVGRFSPQTVYFAVPGQSFDLVIQVSNFECAYSGFWNTMAIGSVESIRHADQLTDAKIFFTYGIVLLISVYALIQYLTNREWKQWIYFCLICVLSVFTIDAVDHQILFQGLMSLHFQWFVFVWFSASLWCVFFLLALCRKLYPTKLASIFYHIYLGCCLLLQVIFTVTNTMFYTNLSDIQNGVSILGIVFATILAIQGIVKGRREGWMNIACIVILLAVYIHDTLLLCNMLYNPLGKMCYFGILLCILLLTMMLMRLNKSYQQMLEASELALLQAQIKPHFVFNALNALIALSYEDVDKTRKLMIRFSQYLRNSFDFTGTNQLVSFDKELEYVRAFLEIEKARFEEQLTIELEIDDDIDAEVPILVLQPVIENAIVHGVLPKTDGGCVWVSIKKQGNQLAFCVKDNGVGFDTAQWEKTKQQESKSGIGLYNIDRRLKKLTKKGLTMKSQIGVGTQISWSIPMGKRRMKNL